METPSLKKQKIAFGNKVREIRESKGLSLLQVSYNCNIDDSKISKIEHGKINITLGTIIDLAKGLSVYPKELLDIEFE
ncbi:MAG: XRE family transcriptional regulator [Flavobacterium sp.]|nr:MAG: XRE family transcriptional regulator [Flavobacterium sp.]